MQHSPTHGQSVFYWAAILFIVAIGLGVLAPIVVAILALGGVPGTAAEVAEVLVGLFLLGLSMFTLLLVLGWIATVRINGLVDAEADIKLSAPPGAKPRRPVVQRL